MFSTYTLKTIFYLLRGNKGSEQFTAVNGYVLVCVLWTPHEKKLFLCFGSVIELKHCKYEVFDHILYRSTVRMLITFTLTCMYPTTSDTQVLQIRNTLNSHFISYTLLVLSRTSSCLRYCLNSSRRCWKYSSGVLIHDTNLLFRHIPKVLSWIKIWWPMRPFEYSNMLEGANKKRGTLWS